MLLFLIEYPPESSHLVLYKTCKFQLFLLKVVEVLFFQLVNQSRLLLVPFSLRQCKQQNIYARTPKLGEALLSCALLHQLNYQGGLRVGSFLRC